MKALRWSQTPLLLQSFISLKAGFYGTCQPTSSCQDKCHRRLGTKWVTGLHFTRAISGAGRWHQFIKALWVVLELVSTQSKNFKEEAAYQFVKLPQKFWQKIKSFLSAHKN